MRVCFWRPPCMNQEGSRFRPRRHCVLAPTVYESGWEAVMPRLSEITILPLSKPIEITFEWNYFLSLSIPIMIHENLCVLGIGSNFLLADFGLCGYCDFPRFVQIFAEQGCMFTMPTQFESILYLFFRAGSILHSNGNLYTSFLYILSKAQHPLYINMVYKWHDLKFIRLDPS